MHQNSYSLAVRLQRAAGSELESSGCSVSLESRNKVTRTNPAVPDDLISDSNFEPLQPDVFIKFSLNGCFFSFKHFL